MFPLQLVIDYPSHFPPIVAEVGSIRLAIGKDYYMRFNIRMRHAALVLTTEEKGILNRLERLRAA